MDSNICIIDALKQSKKGQLKYDNHWIEEGRTEEIVNSIKQNLSTLNLSSRSSKQFINNEQIIVEQFLPISFNPSPTKNELSTKKILDDINDLNKNENSKIEFDILHIDFKLQNYEQEREFKVQLRLEDFRKKLQEKYESMQRNFDDQSRIIEKKYLLESIRHEKKYEEENQKFLMDIENLKEISKQNLSVQDNILRFKEIEEKHKLLLKEEENKKRQQAELKQKIIDLKDKINSDIQETNRELEKIGDFSQDLCHYRNTILCLGQDIELILLSKNEYSHEDVNFCEKTLKKFYEIKELLKQCLENPSKQTNVSENDSPALIHSKMESVVSPPTNELKTETKADTFEHRFKLSKQIYIEHHTSLEKFEDLCKKFYDNESKKPTRTSIQIYIRSIINTISNTSIEHLKEKLIKLLHLFGNKKFEYNGRMVMLSENDYSYQYAINTAVKSLINVANKQKNFAYKIAPVIVILWSNVPMFSIYFQSHLFINCPYAIPYFPVKEENQNDVEYMIICGYQLDKNGSIETDESFQNRIYNLIGLYSAIIQCNMSERHPQDMHYAWRWLAMILNDKPRTVISALILDSFLSMSTHKLYQIYGKQYLKLIQFIKNVYIERITAITDNNHRQTLMKLKSLISDMEKQLNRPNISKENIVKSLTPTGLVPNYFFTKSYLN